LTDQQTTPVGWYAVIMTSMPIKHYTDLKTLLQEKYGEKNNGKPHGFTLQAIMCK